MYTWQQKKRTIFITYWIFQAIKRYTLYYLYVWQDSYAISGPLYSLLQSKFIVVLDNVTHCTLKEPCFESYVTAYCNRTKTKIENDIEPIKINCRIFTADKNLHFFRLIHSAILSTCIKRLPVLKTNLLLSGCLRQGWLYY